MAHAMTVAFPTIAILEYTVHVYPGSSTSYSYCSESQWTCNNEEAESVRLAEYCSEARGAACVCVCVCACALRVRERVCARVWYVLAT